MTSVLLSQNRNDNRKWCFPLTQFKAYFSFFARGSIPSGGNYGTFSLRHRIQIGSGAYPASYPMGSVVSLSLEVKQPGRIVVNFVHLSSARQFYTNKLIFCT